LLNFLFLKFANSHQAPSEETQGNVTIAPDNGSSIFFDGKHPMIYAHQEPIQDIAFSPFLDNVIATASND
jgi:coronin-1B/1C/6